MLLRRSGEIKVSRDRFRCVFIVFLYVTKVFLESVASRLAVSPDVKLFKECKLFSR